MTTPPPPPHSLLFSVKSGGIRIKLPITFYLHPVHFPISAHCVMCTIVVWVSVALGPAKKYTNPITLGVDPLKFAKGTTEVQVKCPI